MKKEATIRMSLVVDLGVYGIDTVETLKLIAKELVKRKYETKHLIAEKSNIKIYQAKWKLFLNNNV